MATHHLRRAAQSAGLSLHQPFAGRVPKEKAPEALASGALSSFKKN
jgi:hypothetical protein